MSAAAPMPSTGAKKHSKVSPAPLRSEPQEMNDAGADDVVYDVNIAFGDSDETWIYTWVRHAYLIPNPNPNPNANPNPNPNRFLPDGPSTQNMS